MPGRRASYSHTACGFAILKFKMSEHKERQPDGGVITSDTVRTPTRWREKRIYVVLLACAVLVVAGCIGLIMWYRLKPAPLPRESASLQQKAIDEATSLAYQGKGTAAQQALDNALAAATSSSDKYEIYLQKCIAYSVQQAYADAIAACQKAATFEQTGQAYEVLGDAAAATGDTQLAISSYQKALAIYTPEIRQPNTQIVKNKLQALGVQPS